MSVTIKVDWDGTPGEWWAAAKFTLTNNAAAPLQDPKIEFTVLSRQKVDKNSGLEIQRSAGSNHVTGRLESWLNTIAPGQTITFSVGVSPADGKAGLGPLPSDLKVNGQGGETPPPKQRPDAPRNLRLVKSTVDCLEFAWDPVSWPAGIRGYWISCGEATPHADEEVTGTRYRLSGLKRDTMYGISVTAIGNDGKAGAMATAHGRTKATDDPKPPPGDRTWDIRAAPFVDACAYPTPKLDEWQTRDDVDGYFLGFVAPLLDKNTGKVRASWGKNATMYDAHDGKTHSGFLAESTYLKARIAELHQRGCQIILSAGGSTAPPLEQDMSVRDAIAEYIAILDNYGTNYLDFDIEGNALATQEQMDRHAEVLLGLRTQRPDVRISHTFSVDIDGWNHHTIALVKTIAAAGYVPDVVQGMLMEMRDPDGDYWLATRRASEAMITQMIADWAWGKVWTTREQAYRHFGMCPMFGVNNNRKFFTLDHMRSLVRYATEKDVAVVAGWDAWRDHNQNNPDSGINPPCGLEVKNIYACTHVAQQPGQFARIVGSFPLQAATATPVQAPLGSHGNLGPSSPRQQVCPDEYPQGDDVLPEIPAPQSCCQPTVNVTVNVDLH